MGELVLRADVAAYNAQLPAGEPHYLPAPPATPPQLTFSYVQALQRWVTPLMDVGRELTCSDAEWKDWQPRSGAGDSFRTNVKADEKAQCFMAALPGRSSAERVLDLGGLLYLARRRRAEGAPSLRCCVWAHELSSPARLLAAVNLGLLGGAGGAGPAAPATPQLSLAGLSPVASQGACVRQSRAPRAARKRPARVALLARGGASPRSAARRRGVLRLLRNPQSGRLRCADAATARRIAALISAVQTRKRLPSEQGKGAHMKPRAACVQLPPLCAA
jgi:hypothetical protein